MAIGFYNPKIGAIKGAIGEFERIVAATPDDCMSDEKYHRMSLMLIGYINRLSSLETPNARKETSTNSRVQKQGRKAKSVKK